MAYIPPSINELKKILFSLKSNESSGYDEINFSAIKRSFGVLHEPLHCLFDV